MNHKYRGKTFSGKEIKGSLILSEDGSRSFIGYIELIDKGRVTVVHYEEVRPETVGQYTGKKDEQGEKLWEGDKATAVWHCTVCFDTSPHELEGRIEWSQEDCMWMFDYGHGAMPLCDERLDRIVKVGNIHEEE